MIKVTLLANNKLNKFLYYGQKNNLNLINNIEKPVCISSLPFSGGLTVLQMLKSGIPVLIYNCGPKSITFASSFYDQRLLFESCEDLNEKIKIIDRNYQYYSGESHKLFEMISKDTRPTQAILDEMEDNKTYITESLGVSNMIEYFKDNLDVLFLFLARYFIVIPVWIILNLILKIKAVYC